MQYENYRPKTIFSKANPHELLHLDWALPDIPVMEIFLRMFADETPSSGISAKHSARQSDGTILTKPASNTLLMTQPTSVITAMMVSNFSMAGKLICGYKKRARGRIFTSFMAEWTGLIVNHKKPLYPTVFKVSNQWHVVKTCGKLMLA